MFQICPKCSYARKTEDTGPIEICPGCGLVYAKYGEASARRDKARLDAKARRQPSSGASRFIVKVLLFVVLIAGASALYRMQHPKATRPVGTTTLPLLANVEAKSDKREFTDLFDENTRFSSLASFGQYTVVEVYLDQCSYCRELEATFNAFQLKRSDVGIIRVHHPGRINNQVQANSREELEAKVQTLNQRMTDYQLCGSPHVEVYGPNREPIALDTCKHRDGTAFLWDWIGTETGAARKSPVGFFTRM